MRGVLKALATVAALAGACALAGCEPPSSGSDLDAAPEPAAFSHDLPEDVSGYYLPVGEVVVGDWALHHLFMGQVPDFLAWEAGPRGAVFGPIMMEFEAGESTRRTRVIPSSYAVTEGRVRFSGRSAEVGEVSFDGQLDQGALATARRNLGDQGVVLKGRLKVGERVFDSVSMRWWAGD